MTVLPAQYSQHSQYQIPSACPVSDLEARRVRAAIEEIREDLTQIIEKSCAETAKPLSFVIQGDPQKGSILGITKLQLPDGREVDLTAPRNPGRAMRTLLRNKAFYNFLVENKFTEVTSPTGKGYTIGSD